MVKTKIVFADKNKNLAQNYESFHWITLTKHCTFVLHFYNYLILTEIFFKLVFYKTKYSKQTIDLFDQNSITNINHI